MRRSTNALVPVVRDDEDAERHQGRVDGVVSTLTPEPSASTPPRVKAHSSAGQIRGSSMLLVGRLLSLGTNFVVHVLIVRHLSADYGAFAYALSLVSLAETVVTLGLDRAVTRFVPIFEERGEQSKLRGTLLLVLGAVTSLGLGVVLLTFGLQGVITGTLINDRQAVSLLLILVFLAPIQALDTVSIGLFAVFARPGAIFLRRYVLAPGLRLVVVLLLVLGGSGATFLAVGYVAAGALGCLVYLGVLYRALRKSGVIGPGGMRGISVPFREVLSFTLPLLTSDLVYTVMHTSDVIMLGYYSGTAEVGAFRAVQPAARLNHLVMSSFALLFMPLAARLFARQDRDGINALYWHTAMWLGVLSFPVFALTFALAEPLTVTLFGAAYADSAVYLSLLSLGYYVQAASGFNGLALKAIGHVRYIVVINLAAAILNIAANLLLIPRYGALGAAIGTLGAMLVHNLLKQLGLRGTGIQLLQREAVRVYLVVASAIAALVAMQQLLEPPLLIGVPLAAVASLFVLAVARPCLQVDAVFPELLRFGIMRKLIGAPEPASRRDRSPQRGP